MPSAKDFSKLRFEDFRQLATDQALSKYERIGFPDSYRAGHEEAIFAEMRHKLPALDAEKRRVLDIGPGCSDIPKMLIELCEARGHQLHLVDSREMLAHLPTKSFIRKTAALFPQCPELIEELRGSVDAIICYSVLHYVFVDTNPFQFLDAALSLLAPGGSLLIADVPNASKRKRFFSSEAGVQFHKEFMKTDEPPLVTFNHLEPDQIDDAAVLGLIARARAAGFDAYVLPQGITLPMSNRREDILVVRP